MYKSSIVVRPAENRLQALARMAGYRAAVGGEFEIQEGVSPMAEEQLVLFRLGDEEYGISIAQVKEIIQYKEATKLPNTPEYMKGIISLRGKIIPVIDLAMRLRLAAANTAEQRALVVETAGQDIGIVVDEVTEVLRLQDSAIEQPPATAANGCIRGIGKEGTRLLILLDVEKLFDEEMIQELKKVS